MEKRASSLAHIRDIILLPFMVTVVIPYFVYTPPVAKPFEATFLGVAGAIIGIFGLLLFCYTVFLFKTIGKGTLAPWSKKQKLVVIGPYRYCRNPMISAVLLILVGETLFLSSWELFAWALIFFIINTTYFIVYEEPRLLKQFGDEYQSYKQQVPRWFPSLKPYRGALN